MTIWQIALSDLARQLSSIRRLGSNLLKAVGAASLVAAALLFHSTAAKADCEVTDTGIPDEAAFKLDPGGLRQVLAKSGVMVSGTYYGESFGTGAASNRASPMTVCST